VRGRFVDHDIPCVAYVIEEKAHVNVAKDRLAALLVAAAITLVAVIPVGRAYLGARRVVGERSAEEVARGSATIANYLGPPEANFLYGDLFKRFANGERRLFPGFAAIVLALVGVWPLRRSSSPARPIARAPMIAYGLGLLLALDLSLGFNGLSYSLLYEYVLPFRGLRIPARTGILAGFSLAVLAGYGADRLAGRTRWVAVAIAVVMLVEYASKPLDLRQMPTQPPESYADLIKDRQDSPPVAIFEFPASAVDDPTYMYYSTFHWQYLVNGYSGFFPPWYARLLNAVRNFPDETSLNVIKAHGARYLLIHGERLFGGRYEEVIAQAEQRRDLTIVSRRPAIGPNGHQEISLYRISYAEGP
jgi:hypothetical protein